MTQVTWLLQDSILDRLIYHEGRLADHIIEAGHRFESVSWSPGGSPPSLDLADRPVVIYGSHEFIRATRATSTLIPGGLGVNDRVHATSYMTNLPQEWFLNRHARLMTWGMFKWHLVHAVDQLPWSRGDRLFIRPNSGFKTFAGTVVNRHRDLDLDIKTLDQLSGVVAETLILVNEAQELEGEFRFVVAGGEVVAGSEYRWDGRLDVRRDWPQACWDLAQQVAQHEWQVDVAYTVDVALVQREPRIVELNSFSCAGLYACDLKSVVRGVSSAAAREWRGDDVDQ